MKCFHETYIPVNSLPKRQSEFLTLLYEYRKACRAMQYKNKGVSAVEIKKAIPIRKMIQELNAQFLTLSKKRELNESGEYEYPRASFKLQDGCLLVCLDNGKLRTRIQEGDILPILPVFKDGVILERNSAIVDLECTIAQLWDVVRNEPDKLFSMGSKERIMALLAQLEQYPITSITRIVFENFLSKKDVEACLQF